MTADSVRESASVCKVSVDPAFTHTQLQCVKANGYYMSPVCLFSFFIYLFCFSVSVALILITFKFNLTPSVIRQRWIVGCQPPAAHPSPWPSGPQAGPWALCCQRESCGLPAGWGGGSLWLLPSSSSFLLFLLLSITSVGGGPSAFSANQFETGERCRLLCVHPPVCCVLFTPFFLSIFSREETQLSM